MKNIHLLPTDNYSPLVHSTNKYGGYFKSEYYSPMKEMGDSYQHIYITNDEEIKDAKWIIYNGKIHEVTKNKGLYISVKKVSHIDIRADLCKKIILTTDQDLIKDGVQAIDDEFLEWFVKNPSCEEVEVYREGYKKNGMIDEATSYQYKIIIPKEEPKQETLEEDLLNIAIQVVGDNNITTIKEFLVKHKWQAERMYSEEEVLNILDKFLVSMLKGEKTGLTEKWFEQFKKK